MTDQISPNAAQVHSDHDRLLVMIDEMRHTTDPTSLLLELETIDRFLTEHFAVEEGPDGLEAVLAEQAPNKVAALRRILGEHGEITATVERCLVKARACVDGPLADLQSEIAYLCAQLLAHEHRETDIIARGLYEDFGGGD